MGLVHGVSSFNTTIVMRHRGNDEIEHGTRVATRVTMALRYGLFIHSLSRFRHNRRLTTTTNESTRVLVVMCFKVRDLSTLHFIRGRLSRPFEQRLNMVHIRNRHFLIKLLSGLVYPIVRKREQIRTTRRRELATATRKLRRTTSGIFSKRLMGFLRPRPPRGTLYELSKLSLTIVIRPTGSSLYTNKRMNTTRKQRNTTPRIERTRHIGDPLSLYGRKFPRNTTPPPRRRDETNTNKIFLSTIRSLRQRGKQFTKTTSAKGVMMNIYVNNCVLVSDVMCDHFILNKISTLRTLGHNDSNHFPNL